MRSLLVSAAATLCGLLPVAPVLAWVCGLGSFEVWFWCTTAPALVALALIGLYLARRRPTDRLRTALVVGTAGGLLGTIGYDLFRVPFAAAGLRVFAPVASYGVLLTGSETSSQLTSFAGWAYHFSNGIGFGIAYAVVALGRHWSWAIAWAMVLETATIVTPFAGLYGLAGHPRLIALAYASHVAYGYALGVVVQRASASRTRLEARLRAPVLALVAALLLFLFAWHRPFYAPADQRAGETVAAGPSAIVADGRFHPEWLHLSVGGCAVLRNTDASAYELSGPGVPRSLPAADDTTVCFPKAGVFRVRTSATAYSGGFVIVDAQERR
jgi:hypothetical protein